MKLTGTARYLLPLIVAICVLFPVPPGAGADEPDEYEIKAAFLYNFTKFVTWPGSAFENDRSPIVIGILGENPFDNLLEKTVDGKQVDGRDFVIKRFKRIEDVERCQILFVRLTDTDRVARLLDALELHGVLTVGDTDRFAGTGGVIGFFKDDDRIRFEINMDAAEASGLKISSRMLSLARFVSCEGEER